jgi:ATP-binding cassette subfamily F protein 3
LRSSRDRPPTAAGPDAPRPVPLLGLGDAHAPSHGALGRRAEATNHLDVESREALEGALEAFPGAILLVSHDRALLDAVPDRIVAVEARSLRSYEGGWADLKALSAKAASASPKPTRTKSRPTGTRAAASNAPSELELLEARITATEAQVEELERTLANDWTNMDALAAHLAARDSLKELLERWEVLFSEAEAG